MDRDLLQYRNDPSLTDVKLVGETMSSRRFVRYLLEREANGCPGVLVQKTRLCCDHGSHGKGRVTERWSSWAVSIELKEKGERCTLACASAAAEFQSWCWCEQHQTVHGEQYPAFAVSASAEYPQSSLGIQLHRPSYPGLSCLEYPFGRRLMETMNDDHLTLGCEMTQ